MIGRIAAFADDYGLPLLVRHLPPGRLAAVVAASIRPQQHATLEALATREGLPLLVQPARGGTGYEAFLAALRAYAPDFAIVNSYSMKLWPELTAVFAGGGINLHGGLLPAYRGANPIQWALIRNEREAGVTMHVLSEEIDAGPIFAQRRVPVAFADTWLDVQRKIADATDTLLADTLPGVLAGTAVPKPQDESRARYYRRRRPEDGRFDWSWRILDIYNLIRALVAPHPGAFVDECGARRVFDRYLTVSEVAALKLSNAGQRAVRSGALILRPVGAPSNEELAFDAEDAAVRIADIDWDARTARVVTSHDARAVVDALRTFCRVELGLEAA